jgi:hypothetical protein
MAIILGIDPSISATGLIVINTEDFKILYQTTIKNPPGASANYCMDPYDQIRGGLQMVIREYGVEHAYIEKMFIGPNGTTVELLFCAAFTARQACHDLKVPFHIIPVNGVNIGWRWFSLGSEYSKYKGAQAKIANRAILGSALGVKLSSEHVADAAGVALAGWFYQTGVDFRDVRGVSKPEFTKPIEAKDASKSKKRKPRTPIC